jgi:hypothetical protein
MVQDRGENLSRMRTCGSVRARLAEAVGPTWRQLGGRGGRNGTRARSTLNLLVLVE